MGFPKFNAEALKIITKSPSAYLRSSGFDKAEMVMSTKDRIRKMIVKNPGISLKKDDFCLYMAYAFIGKQVTRV